MPSVQHAAFLKGIGRHGRRAECRLDVGVGMQLEEAWPLAIVAFVCARERRGRQGMGKDSVTAGQDGKGRNEAKRLEGD